MSQPKDDTGKANPPETPEEVEHKEELDEKLDEALEETFPASDPVALSPAEEESVEPPRH